MSSAYRPPLRAERWSNRHVCLRIAIDEEPPLSAGGLWANPALATCFLANSTYKWGSETPRRTWFGAQVVGGKSLTGKVWETTLRGRKSVPPK